MTTVFVVSVGTAGNRATDGDNVDGQNASTASVSEDSGSGAGPAPQQPGSETGLIIPVPQLEDFVCGWRDTVDCVSPEGVPAHISVLYPFLEPDRTGPARDEVAEFFANTRAFDYELTDIGWFEDRVVFVRPAPEDPFLDLIGRLMTRWTQCLPYGGKHRDLVPHLTLGIDGDKAQMTRLADAARELLPVQCRATEAWLMIGTSHPPNWDVADKFNLG